MGSRKLSCSFSLLVLLMTVSMEGFWDLDEVKSVEGRPSLAILCMTQLSRDFEILVQKAMSAPEESSQECDTRCCLHSLLPAQAKASLRHVPYKQKQGKAREPRPAHSPLEQLLEL